MDYYAMTLDADVPFSRRDLRQAAFGELARVAPRFFGIKGHRITIHQQRYAFHLSSLEDHDWGMVFLALVDLCDFYRIYWRVQCRTNEDARPAGGFKARATGQWYKGENVAEALLYAVVSANLYLHTDVSEEFNFQ